jgi:Na+/H+ antiporter
MRDFELVLLILSAAVAVQPLARRLDVPLPIAQVVIGAALSGLPFVPRVDFDPDLVFALLVPPLLYTAAATGSLRDTRREARAILLLAVGLLLVTIGAVALVAHRVIPHTSWPVAFVLAAIVSPPDADVTTGIARRLGLPARLVTIIEGETLWNDTTALVSFRAAVAAAVTGIYVPMRFATSAIVIVAVSVVCGVALGWVMSKIRSRVTDPMAGVTVSLLTPFIAYLLVERLGASGVLAVVVTGICVSRFLPRTIAPVIRVRGYLVWDVMRFLIGGLVFTLLGLELGHVLPRFWQRGGGELLSATVAVGATLVAVRLLWVFMICVISPRAARVRTDTSITGWRQAVVVGWAGLRGGDSLVMALAIPLVTAAGTPFPNRDAVIDVGLGVVLLTLVVQGLTLRPLIRGLGFPFDASVAREERLARRTAELAARRHLRHVARTTSLPGVLESYLDAVIRQRTRLDLDDIDHHHGHDGHTLADALRLAEREVRDASRAAIVELRDTNAIGDEALRRVLNDIDLEELRQAASEEEGR